MESRKERYSFSKLNTFNSCLLSYIYNYIIKEEQEPNGFGEFGTFVHLLLQRWALGELEIFELLDRYVEEYEKNVTAKFPLKRNKESMGVDYYRDGYNFFKNFDGIGDYTIIGVEEKFEIEIEGFIFNGVIDLIVKDKDNNIIIIDWKSKKEFNDETEEAEYRRQLYLYSNHIKKKYGKWPTKTIFYCFRQMKPYEKDFDMDAYNEAMKWMFDTVAKIRSLFKCYDWFFCSSLCGFSKVCGIKKEMESNKDFAKIIKDLKKEDKVVTDDCLI